MVRRRLGRGLCAALLVAAASSLVGFAPGAGGVATSAATSTPVAGGIVPCPAGDPVADTCAAMPCPTGHNCGTIVAGPTTDLGANQFVYLHFSGFAPGDNGITVYYCSDPGLGDTLSGGPPTCGTQGPQNFQQLQIFPSSSSSVLPPGTTEASVQTAEVSPPSTPLSGAQFHPTVDQPGGFYCGDTPANGCAIVVTDASINGQPVSSPLNSVEIPISFAPTTSGCPNAPVVSTESEFGIDVLMPQLARISCADDPGKAIIPFETATDGLQAVTDMVHAQQQVAFTDNPEAPDQQALLKKGGFALIPVALTANVVGFFAQLKFTGFYNQDQMDLTPTMAAGLLTNASNYNDAAHTDDVDPCSGPSLGTGGNCLFGPGPCFGGQTCSLFSQLNFVNGFEQFTSASAFQRSDSSGATGGLFDWLCSAPVVPLDFGSHPVEAMSGSQELEVGLTPANGKPPASCPVGTDQVPAVGGSSLFTTVNDPSQQALKAYNAVFESGSANPYAAFADMNWAEASYFGMNIAALQNAADAFVPPTQQSLDAAALDAAPNPDGSYTFRNLPTDPAAYPTASLIYAVVPTAPMAAAPASDVTQLLTQLLQLTSGKDAATDPSAQLPLGFEPLPANLLQQAQTDVASDIHVQAPGTQAGSSGSKAGGGANSSVGALPLAADAAANGGDSLFAGGYAGFLPLEQALLSSATRAAGKATAAGEHAQPASPLLGPELPGLALAARQGMLLVPAALDIGLAALVIGALLLTRGYLSRRRFQRIAALPQAAGTAQEGP